MEEQRIREIAEAAFKARFGDIDVVSINVKRRYDYHDDELQTIVKIIYDGKVEQLTGQDTPHSMEVRSEIIDKVLEAEDSSNWPQVHFIAKSDIGRRDPATV